MNFQLIKLLAGRERVPTPTSCGELPRLTHPSPGQGAGRCPGPGKGQAQASTAHARPQARARAEAQVKKTSKLNIRIRTVPLVLDACRGGALGDLWAEHGGRENVAEVRRGVSPKNQWPDVAGQSSDGDETWGNRRCMIRRSHIPWPWEEPAPSPSIQAL